LFTLQINYKTRLPGEYHKLDLSETALHNAHVPMYRTKVKDAVTE